MRILTGANITKLIESFCYKDKDEMNYVIEMDYCGLGPVSSYKSYVNNEFIQAIARDVACSLIEINKHNMIHLDIKPQNILLNSSGDIKLCDFGTAKSIDSKDESIEIKKEGTLLYMAHEIKSKKSLSFQADIYSLGMTLFEMISGVPLGLTKHNYYFR